MVSFAEIVDGVQHLSLPEIKKLQDTLRQKEKEKEERQLLESSNKAMNEYLEGRSVTFENPEEIKVFLEQLINDKD